MSWNPGSLISRYGCACGSIALAIWGQLLLDPVIDMRFLCAPVFLAVLVTAWYGGFQPALAAVVLGAFASYFFFMPSRGSFVLASLDQQIGLILYYIFTGLGIALIAGSMHRARQRAESTAESVRRQAMLIDQTHDAVLVWDWDGLITFWNRGAERLYGFPHQEALGRMRHALLGANTHGHSHRNATARGLVGRGITAHYAGRPYSACGVSHGTAP